jgi:hypothetical protein
MVAVHSHTPEQGAALVDVLIFIALIVLLIGGTMSAALWLTRGKPTQTKLVLLGAASGAAEARLWVERLRRAGVKAHMRNVGDSAWYTSSAAYEVWVRPRDEARARAVLGL